ncbi:MAG: anthranilate phosphoribosyltransferase [Tenacibaculum sp.]
MKEILEKLYQHKRLSKQEAKEVLTSIAQGKYNEAHLASFLTVFMLRPIAVDELAGFREVLLELAVKINLSDFNTIDIVGTGGDGKDTFNISTLASFVVAGTGQKVAKHGNYSVSSKSGSSDVLQALGYEFSNDESTLKRQLEKANLCFLHAPAFHPAMKAVKSVRKALKLKTFFNILGPLVNPSLPQNLFLGTYNLEVARLYSYILQKEKLNYSIVHSLDGYDEISLTSAFKLFNTDGERMISPSELNFKNVQQTDIYGGNSVANATKIFVKIINGKGTEAQNNVVLSNAAFALSLIDNKKSFKAAYQQAKESLLGLKAKECLNKLVNT